MMQGLFTSTLDRKRWLFDRWAPSYDWLLPSVFYQAVHQRLLEFVDLPRQATVLDLGCGTGRLLNRLASQFPDLQGTGLDLSVEMLQRARQRNCHRPRLVFVQGNAAALPFAEGQFDGVFSTFSFLHYPQPELVLREIGRVLGSQGQFYLVDFTPGSPFQEAAVLPGAIRFYSSAFREKLGLEAGLTCQGHHYLLGSVLLTVFSKNL